MKQPAAAQSHRVPRSPVDDFFQKGRPPAPTRMGGGEVTAIEDADTVTVDMNDEVVEGVFVQGNMPEVGDQIEVWALDDEFYTPGIDDPDVVLISPDGTQYRLVVNNAGDLSTEAI